ncbi:MAG TPA: hypothetical protein VG184_10675 [Acidimicrobiales bacterium]|jgi:hypothetical protein|nr:hypothetical protein [Acidimicrobiales bacterium]
MADHTLPNADTRAEEALQAQKDHEAGRGPTPDEEAAAEAHAISPETESHYEDMAERGANQQGEGRLP